jgi:energy-coupling factor transport system ATP-binding protein
LPAISTENLTHIYSQGTPFEHTAVKDINFSAEKGEFLAIIGHTGSGKSTFIQHLNGLIRPTSGRVLFNGRDIFQDKSFTKQVRFKVGLVFQYPEYQLFEETAYQDIAFGPKNMKLSEKEIDERVREAAEFVGLPENILQKSPFELSGGQKRRVAIAGVIAMRPEVLILDEPTAGLDPAGRDSIIDNIKTYHKAMDSTVIMVTHSMEEAARTADRMVVFHDGVIAMDGAPAEVFSHPKELTSMGLDLPDATKIAVKLREKGLALNTPVYTNEQLVNALVKMKGGKADA